jgi:hypothetical protein
MQHRKRSQTGASLSGILLGLVLAALLGTVAIKLAPHYMTFLTVKSVMNDIEEDPETAGLGRKAVLDLVNKRLYINGVSSVSTDVFTFTPQQRGKELGVQYEVREHLFGNLDALLTFAHKVRIKD